MHEFIRLSREYLSSFEATDCCKIPYIKKGILNIEGFYWWAMVGYFRPDIILESGVANGRSTEILARAQQHFSIDKHLSAEVDRQYEKTASRLSSYATEFVFESSPIVFERVYRVNPDAKIVAVVDGPKSGGPFKKVIQCLGKFKNLCAVGCHDCQPGSRIPANLDKYSKEYLRPKIMTITDDKVNSDLSYLNGHLKSQIIKQAGKAKMRELCYRSNFIGLCL